MSLSTSEKNPSHAHTIAKNLLDLLAQPILPVGEKGRALLYFDDRQIHGLSISSRHGQKKSNIFIIASPLRDFLVDLALAVHAGAELDDHANFDLFEDDNAIETYRNFLMDRKVRQGISQDAYDSFVGFLRQQATTASAPRVGHFFESPSISFRCK
jgi:hypothetical protein